MSISPFEGWPSMEALLARQENAEQSVSHLNKLAAELLTEELQKTVNEMRELAKDLPRNWPEIAVKAASIRGYAFNAFRICAEYRRRETPSWPQRRFNPVVPKTIDDLL